MNAVDIAALLDTLEDEQQPLTYRLLPKETAADAFAYLESETQETLIHAFTEREIKAIMEDLYADDVVDMLEEMPANVTKRLLRAVSAEKRSEINQLLQYPEDSAGSVMAIELVDLKADMTVEERLQLPGMQPHRADIVVHGICILLAVMKRLNIASIRVSEYGNMDGYMKRRYAIRGEIIQQS